MVELWLVVSASTSSEASYGRILVSASTSSELAFMPT